MEVSTVKSILPAVLLLFAATLSAGEWSVSSPDGRTSITLAQQADGRLSLRAARATAAVVEDSPLGIRRAGQPFTTRLKPLRASDRPPTDARYEIPHGTRR